VGHRIAIARAGIVDEDVEPPVTGRDVVERRGHGGFIGDVENERLGA
jgi:hypothetical protein